MAVIAMWKCDRDDTMFDDKKSADAYDKMLELGEVFARLLKQIVPEVDENKAEDFGLILARNKEQVVLACKGKIEAMEEVISGPDNVVKLEAAETN
ncbi:MAG: YebG family protein [Chromatiales bacterium]|nr:YebG family protein [Chromatiales bacterium]